jgi:hypothetical protein
LWRQIDFDCDGGGGRCVAGGNAKNSNQNQYAYALLGEEGEQSGEDRNQGERGCETSFRCGRRMYFGFEIQSKKEAVTGSS